ncbi:MAG: alpha/beta hydrolase [Acutalibacteraceae bacterium]
MIEKNNCDHEKKPLLIYIHGGGWLSGLRKARRFYCENWAEQGYICANIGYDYSLDARHPEHIRQIFKGIEYVLDHAEQYHIDTSRVVVAGESAGGYFASLVGVVTSHHELYDSMKIEFQYQSDFKADALVLMSGIYDPIRSLDTKFQNMELFIEALCGMPLDQIRQEYAAGNLKGLSPSDYTDSSFPPSFIVGSKYDLLLPESVALHNDLDKAGVKNEFFVCTKINGVHAGSLACDTATGKTAVKKAQEFVRGVLEEKCEHAK